MHVYMQLAYHHAFRFKQDFLIIFHAKRCFILITKNVQFRYLNNQFDPFLWFEL
ncbi:hypothetical protein Hanom_Chr16g01459191 [Helianthus anomalus]